MGYFKDILKYEKKYRKFTVLNIVFNIFYALFNVLSVLAFIPVLGILFGSLGIHKFVLGYNKEGFIQILISFLTCGAAGIIGFIEGIIYLTKSDEEFYQTYQVGKRPWF